MHFLNRRLLSIGFLLLFCMLTQGEDELQTPVVSFSSEIAPILQQHCAACHGKQLAESGYRLDSYEKMLSEMTSGQQAIVAGDPEKSELFQRLVHEDDDLKMPLDADSLNDEQIQLVRRWIESGANFDGGSVKQTLASLLPIVMHPSAPTKYRAALPVSAIAISPDSEEIYVGGYHEITAWNLSGKLLRRFANQGQRTYSIDLHPSDPRLLASGGTPGRLGEVRLFDQKSQNYVTTLIRAEEVILSAKFSPDGKRIAVGMPDGSVQVFDSQTQEKVQTLLGHSDQITSLVWHPTEDRIGTTSRDKSAKIFDVGLARSVSTFAGHTDCVNALAFLDGDEVITVSDDGKAVVWSLRDGRRRRDAIAGKMPLLDVVRLGQRYLVSGVNETHIFEVGSNRKLKGVVSQGDWMTTLAKQGIENLVVIGLHSGEVVVRNQQDTIDRFFAQP